VATRSEFRQVADASENVRILYDDAARVRVNRVQQALEVGLGPSSGKAVSSTSPVNRAMVRQTST
jgi:hypothetical protein